MDSQREIKLQTKNICHSMEGQIQSKEDQKLMKRILLILTEIIQSQRRYFIAPLT